MSRPARRRARLRPALGLLQLEPRAPELEMLPALAGSAPAPPRPSAPVFGPQRGFQVTSTQVTSYKRAVGRGRGERHHQPGAERAAPNVYSLAINCGVANPSLAQWSDLGLSRVPGEVLGKVESAAGG